MVSDLFNCYNKIGNGSFSRTYFTTIDNVTYTIKQYKLTTSNKMFDNEVNILTLLREYNDIICIPQLYNIDTINRCIIYNYVYGMSLDKILYDQCILELLLEQVLQTLHTIHHIGIAHRDIKPSNILYDDQTTTFTLIDYGLSHIITSTTHLPSPLSLSSSHPSSHHSHSLIDSNNIVDNCELEEEEGGRREECVNINHCELGNVNSNNNNINCCKLKVAGTVGYILPHIVETQSYEDTKQLLSSDIFALGVCAYEYINKHKPFYVSNNSNYINSYRGDHRMSRLPIHIRDCIKVMLFTPHECYPEMLLYNYLS